MTIVFTKQEIEDSVNFDRTFAFAVQGILSDCGVEIETPANVVDAIETALANGWDVKFES